MASTRASEQPKPESFAPVGDYFAFRDGPTSSVNSEGTVVEAIFRHGRMSRAEMARVTGLSKPTVSAVIETLESAGLVRQAGWDSGQPGRPPLLFEFAADTGYVIGIDVGGTKVRGALTDILGEVVAERTEPTNNQSLAAFAAQLAALCEALLETAGLEPDRVEAIGLGIPGIYDESTDTVRAAHNLPVIEAGRFVTALASDIAWPILVDNDVNLAAIGEQWCGLASGIDDYASISIGTGVGMGLVLQGEIFRGATGAAGEIGSMPLRDNQFLLASNYPDLESAISGRGVLKRLTDGLSEEPDTRLTADSRVADVFAAAQAGDGFAQQLVESEAEMLAMAIAWTAFVLDLPLVVLGGGIGSNETLARRVRETVNELVPQPPRIETSALGDRAAMFGAIAIALRAARRILLEEASR